MTAALLVGAGATTLVGAMSAPLWNPLLAAVPRTIGPSEGPPLQSPAAAPVRPLPPPPAEADPPVLRLRNMGPAEAVAYNASIPISGAPNPSAAALRLNASAVDSERAVDCLTAAVYYEAASESQQGQRAVAQVVLNRLVRPAFPKTVCGVVFQGAERASGCQFTFACDGSLNRRPTAQGWAQAHDIAVAALAGTVEPTVGGATHYHTVSVAPYWSPGLIKVAHIGAHVFYVWLGAGAAGPWPAVYAGHEIDVPRTRAIDEAMAGAAGAGTPTREQATLELASPAPLAHAETVAALGTPRPLPTPTLTAPTPVEFGDPRPAQRIAAAEASRLPVPRNW